MTELEGMEISGEGSETFSKMLKVLESNMNKQIGALEQKIGRLILLENDVDSLKQNGIASSFDDATMKRLKEGEVLTPE